MTATPLQINRDARFAHAVAASLSTRLGLKLRPKEDVSAESLLVAREVVSGEGKKWESMDVHARLEIVGAVGNVLAAYKKVRTEREISGPVHEHEFPASTRHAAFIAGMLWQLDGAVPFQPEMRRAHAEAILRYGPCDDEAISAAREDFASLVDKLSHEGGAASQSESFAEEMAAFVLQHGALVHELLADPVAHG